MSKKSWIFKRKIKSQFIKNKRLFDIQDKNV
jgi:hypothetical protein